MIKADVDGSGALGLGVDFVGTEGDAAVGVLGSEVIFSPMPSVAGAALLRAFFFFVIAGLRLP